VNKSARLDQSDRSDSASVFEGASNLKDSAALFGVFQGVPAKRHGSEDSGETVRLLAGLSGTRLLGL
jgi:hypothetical protein